MTKNKVEKTTHKLISEGTKGTRADSNLEAFWVDSILEVKKGFMSLLLSESQAFDLADWLSHQTESSSQKEIDELKEKLKEYKKTDEERYMNFEQKLSDVIKSYEEQLSEATQTERERCYKEWYKFMFDSNLQSKFGITTNWLKSQIKQEDKR